MKPFKLRVNWFLWSKGCGPVEVELHMMGFEPWTLRTFPGPPSAEAVQWAVQYLRGRGLCFLCDIDGHQMRDDTHITLHAVPEGKCNHPPGKCPSRESNPERRD